MMIIHKFKRDEFVIVPYRRPKWDGLHYASAPVDTVPAAEIETELFKRLGATLAEDKEGIQPESRQRLGLSVDDEKSLLTDANAIFLGAKGVVSGFAANIAKFTPCVIKQRRLHKVLDKDPSLNIEVNYPMTFDEFVKAFRLAFERAD